MKKILASVLSASLLLGLGATALAQKAVETKLVMAAISLPRVLRLGGDELELRVTFKVTGPTKPSYAPVHVKLSATSNGTVLNLGGNELELVPSPSAEPATLVGVVKFKIAEGGKPRPVHLVVDGGVTGQLAQDFEAKDVVAP